MLPVAYSQLQRKMCSIILTVPEEEQHCVFTVNENKLQSLINVCLWLGQMTNNNVLHHSRRRLVLEERIAFFPPNININRLIKELRSEFEIVNCQAGAALNAKCRLHYSIIVYSIYIFFSLVKRLIHSVWSFYRVMNLQSLTKSPQKENKFNPQKSWSWLHFWNLHAKL